MNTATLKKPTIIIVDDHLIFRQGLKSILTADNFATVIGEASNGIELLELLAVKKPDIVLMDIDMPHMNGIVATEEALKLIPDLKIIAFTMYGDEDFYYKMIDRGVKGFILKTSGISELENAISEIMLGESYFSNELLRKIITNFSNKNTELESIIKSFTDRELEILQQICLGLNNEEIAEKLFISPKTVKTHKSKLLEKSNAKNVPGLILFAIKNKIVKL
jgi:DNA-binding NarL/FixJ family response regulator